MKPCYSSSKYATAAEECRYQESAGSLQTHELNASCNSSCYELASQGAPRFQFQLGQSEQILLDFLQFDFSVSILLQSLPVIKSYFSRLLTSTVVVLTSRFPRTSLFVKSKNLSKSPTMNKDLFIIGRFLSKSSVLPS